MKIFIYILLLLTSTSTFASRIIDNEVLENLLKRCIVARNEALCLRQGIQDFIYERNEASPLICRGYGSKFAVYNQKNSDFIDNYYSKTIDDCNAAIRNSRGGLICASTRDGKTAVKNYETDKFIDTYYSKSLSDCMKTIDSTRNGIICVATSDGKTARYNYLTGKFIDGQYAYSVDECIRMIP